MRFAPDRLWSDPEKAARKLLEIANAVEVVQDGRIYIELINGPFLFRNAGRIQGRPELGDRARLTGASRIRNLCEVHAPGADLFA